MTQTEVVPSGGGWGVGGVRINDNALYFALALTSSLNILTLAQLNQHLRRRVHNLHLAQNSRSIVTDENLSVALLDHLVHAPGAEGGADGGCDGLGGDDVGHADVLALGALIEGLS